MPLTVDCVVLKQKNVELYLFKMSAHQLLQITYVDPQTRDDPEQIQRLLDGKRLKEIGEFIKHPSSLIPNNIVINLNPEVAVQKHSNGNTGTLVFPDEVGKYGYILDGQHRLKGFEYADGIDFDLAVIAMHNADKHKAGKVFVDINTNQRPADKRLIFNIREAIGDLPNQQERAGAIVEDLDTLEESPLSGKIARFEDDTRRWVRAPTLIGWISKIVDVGGDLAGRSRNEQTEILISYLNAVKEMWPDAYANRTEYYVWYPSGIQVVLEIFPNVYKRVMVKYGSMFTKENFMDRMEPIKDYAVVGEIPWGKEGYKPYTSGAGRNLLTRSLQNQLPPI
jgi:DGQHR domain-containing protein